MNPRSPRRRRAGAILLGLLTIASVAACGGADPQPAGSAASAAPAEAVTVTMWTRAATQAQSERLVAAYNKGHKNQVKMTVIPTDNYQPRIAAAAGAKQLPDIFASDVIFVPNYTSQGLFLDITDRINALPFKDKLSPSHMKLGTLDGRQYTLPHTLDLSVWFWNKDLYAKAGLDPEKGPTTLKEFAEQATTVDEKLGKDGKVSGTFFGGNCGGCYVFTFWPSVWAVGRAGHEPRGHDLAQRPARDDGRVRRSTASCTPRASPARRPRRSRARPGPASSPRARSASCRCPRPRSA